MTTKNIIFAATLAVVNVFGAFAQETSANKDVFEFDSKRFRDVGRSKECVYEKH